MFIYILLKKVLDMFLLLLVFVFVCICYVDIIICYYEFINVVYLKLVILSFFFDNDLCYVGFKVVNGLFFDFIVIVVERFLWLRIDFGVRFEINEIEVFVRVDCCGKFYFL